MTLEQNSVKLRGLITGFIIVLLLLNGGDFLFVRIYKHLERDFVPIVYTLINALALILTNWYMFYQYRFFPIFIRNSLKESLMTSFAGIVLIWIVVVFEVLLFFGNRSHDPFIRYLIDLPSPQFYMGLIMVTFISPFFEEILMRGFFFEIVKRRWNVGISLLIVVSFSYLMHYTLRDFP